MRQLHSVHEMSSVHGSTSYLAETKVPFRDLLPELANCQTHHTAFACGACELRTQ